MVALTLGIRNTRIVDGAGRPAYAGDFRVTGDRIAAVGNIRGRADVEIDARGLVLAPGFIDIHTHCNPQLCWDKLATPTPDDEVTTIVVGNCSLSLAPVRGDGHRKITRLFGVVEDLDPEIATGRFADLVLFDPATMKRGEEIWVDDVPDGGGRYVRHAEGLDKVIVDGQIVVDRGSYTAARPGAII